MRSREPRLSRVDRTRSVVVATTGMFGVSSTRRAAILAVVVCALALTVVGPLRNYVTQRQDLAAITKQQQSLAADVQQLSRERARLSDPAEVEAQARTRLGYVMPGEVPYVVQLPLGPNPATANENGAGMPWYERLWHEVGEAPR
jgi:cell division protein FtsB